jgi:dTDP-4-dehydrorhamnose reductase
MLGSTVAVFLGQNNFEVTEFNRSNNPIASANKSAVLDINPYMTYKNLLALEDFDVIVNAIGLVRQVIDESNEIQVELAHYVNAEFSRLLDELGFKSGIPVIQIGTDCVFSGVVGRQTESSQHSYTDLYSFTKMVGEDISKNTKILRTSIVGMEFHSSHSLLNWVLKQPIGAKINGFNNHYWNGVTTLHFAKLVSGVIKNKEFTPGIQHVIPRNIVSKYDLVRCIADEFDRTDLEILDYEANERIDRSLGTDFPDKNLQLWENGGYEVLPTVEEMLNEYASWDNKFMQKLRNSYNTNR